MKKRFFISLLLVLGIVLLSKGQGVNQETAQAVAQQFINLKHPGYSTGPINNIGPDGTTLAYRIDLLPHGFIIVSAGIRSRPVLAYSFTDGFALCHESKQVAENYLIAIVEAYNGIDKAMDHVRAEWDLYLSANNAPYNTFFEQWPPEGTTTTGGWLGQNWKQGYPYNTMCPMDLNSGSRSIAGCPAVAMASVLNYNLQTNEVQFTDNDDYYHSFGSGNQYWIDNDFESRDFPAFAELNTYILSLQDKYDRGETPSQQEVAALNFACGVACKQVYSSSISGTYGIEQAYVAYQRFGFDSVKLIYDTDTTLNQQLAGNMKIALPAHIGLVDEGYTVGHNLVGDGYNTDEYYHFNFGWGGSSNGWYTMPPVNIPYNLTVIEGLILDINLEGIYVGMDHESARPLLLEVYPNPVKTRLLISGSLYEGYSINIYSLCGQLLKGETLSQNTSTYEIDFSHFPNGVYFVELLSKDRKIVSKVIK